MHKTRRGANDLDKVQTQHSECLPGTSATEPSTSSEQAPIESTDCSITTETAAAVDVSLTDATHCGKQPFSLIERFRLMLPGRRRSTNEFFRELSRREGVGDVGILVTPSSSTVE